MSYEPPQEPGNPAYPPYQQDPRTWPAQGQPPYAPHAAPYGQQPYPPQGPPSGPPQCRRKRHPLRTVLISAGAVVVAVVAISVAASAGSNSHTLTSTGSSSSPAASTSGKPPAKAAGSTSAARIGSSITLSGNGDGEQMKVTVLKVSRHPGPASGADIPDPGKRLYAVQFRLTDTGSAAYSDAPSNGAVVVDSDGQSYDSTIMDAAGCTSFPGTENIGPGSSGLGCVVFQVPTTAKIVKVQFTLDSGMGPDTGQWDVALNG